MNENIYLPHIMVIEKITVEAPGVKTFRLKFQNEEEGKKTEKVKDGMEYLEYRIEYQIKPIYEEYIKDGIIKKDGKAKVNKSIEDVPLGYEH